MIDLNKIYNEDCLEGMKRIPDGSVDMILCDLPYGTTACKWDVVIPFNKHIKEINNRGKEIILYRDEYILQEVKKGKSYKDTINYFDNNAIDGLWDNYNRIIKDSGAIVLFGSEPFSSCLRLSNLTDYKYDLYWKKEKPTNFFQLKKRFGKCTENIIIFYSKQPTYNPQKYKHEGKLVKNNPKGNHNSIVAGINKKVFPYNDDGTRYPNDILEFRRDVLGTTIHPTQKPVALLEYLIKTYTLEGETVLDNCMGSGSTAIACINTNRNFIGIEKDDTYFEIAKKRIEEHLTTAST